MEMNNQIIIMSGILSVTLLLPTITPEFLTLAASNAFGQQVSAQRVKIPFLLLVYELIR